MITSAWGGDPNGWSCLETIDPKLVVEGGHAGLFGSSRWLSLHEVASHSDREFDPAGLLRLLITPDAVSLRNYNYLS